MRRFVTVIALLALVGVAGCGDDDDSGDDSSGDGSGDGASEETILFVATAEGGTLGADGQLSLTGVDPDALFFTDRPARDTGIITVTRMFQILADSSDEGPPNAAVEINQDAAGPTVMALELESPTYDATTATLSFATQPLDSVTGTRLDHLEDRLGETLPPEFGKVTLFIDSSPFGSTNFCMVQVQNYTEQNVTLSDQSKWSTDTWDPAPPGNGFVLGLGSTASWQSDGGFARGCGNSTTWTQEDGTTFHTSITDPYGDDPNSISCTSSDPNGHPCHLDPQSTTRGAAIDVIFYFCDNARQSGCPGQ